MPTICFISYEIHPTTAGGCGVLIRHAAERLNAAGWRIVFLLDIPRDLFDRFISEQIPLFPTPEKVKAVHVNDLIPEALQEPRPDFDIFRLKSRRFAAAVHTLTTRERIDIVESFDYCGPGYDLQVGELFQDSAVTCPTLVTRIHGSIEVLERYGGGLVRDRSRMLQLACERAALRLSNALLTPSKTYFDRYYAPLYGLDAAKAHVSTPPKRAIGTVTKEPKEGAFSIAFVGRLFHLKGVDTLVFAAAELMREFPNEDFVVDLIGYDSTETPFPDAGPMYGDYLRSVIPADLFHRFRFKGQIPQEQILDSLQHARFAVFPNRVESFCYALHEIYDAGVPVIVHDLPAFRDFFVDGDNCLTFDGTATHLIACMRRLMKEENLRRSIARPRAVAESGFADWYFTSQSPKTTIQDSPPSKRVSVVVLADSPQSRETCAAARSIAGLKNSESCDIYYATRCNPRLPGTFWILGESRIFTDRHGNPIDPLSIRTTDAILILHQDDHFDSEWIADCTRALFRREDVAFAGTWTTVDGNLRESSLDILPEVEVFERPRELHRVVLRTEPGVHLPDLFDATLGPLGFLGLIWKTCAQRGNGVLLPEGRLHMRQTCPLQPNATHVKSLLLRHGAPFAENIALYAGLTEPAALKPPSPTPPPPASNPIESIDRFAIAETLGGRTLLRMAVAKLMTRIKCLIS